MRWKGNQEYKDKWAKGAKRQEGRGKEDWDHGGEESFLDAVNG